MKKQRFYFDTSVFGGIHDDEFRVETLKLFEMVESGDISCLYSDITEYELNSAPTLIVDHFKSIPSANREFIELSLEAEELAQNYIKEKVVGKTSIDDCRHIAVATTANADCLVSWNFKHIVNVFRIRGYNAINIKLGYNTLEIRSPREIVNYE